MKTIIELFESRITRLCALVAAGMLWIAGYNLIPWSCLTPSDLGTWVGAIGTVGTLIVAIRIANTQERNRQEDAIKIARVTAASMLHQVVRLRHQLRDVIETIYKIECDNELGDVPHVGDFRRALGVLQTIAIWDGEQLARLSPLPGDCGFRLAYGLDRLQSAAAHIRQELSVPEFSSDYHAQGTTANSVRFQLNEADRSLNLAVMQMLIETRAHTQYPKD